MVCNICEICGNQEYDNFFKSLTKEFDAPIEKIHFTAEGEIQFRSILFIPKKAPSDLYDKLQVSYPSFALLGLLDEFYAF